MTGPIAPILPRHGGAADRVMPWVLAPMICLAVAAAIALVGLFGIAGQWRDGLAGGATVVIPAGAATDEDVASLLDRLMLAPEVSSVRRISGDEVEALVAPWLGVGASTDGLPLPILLDIRFAGLGTAPPGLEALVADALPAARLEDHGRRLSDLLRLIGGLQMAALIGLALILVTATITMVAATQASLAAHRRIVDTLYTLGADDRFITRAFERHARRLAARGALIGAIGAPLVIAAVVVGSGLGDRLWPGAVGLAVAVLVGLAMPPALVLLAGLSARVTVHRHLQDLL